MVGLHECQLLERRDAYGSGRGHGVAGARIMPGAAPGVGRGAVVIAVFETVDAVIEHGDLVAERVVAVDHAAAANQQVAGLAGRCERGRLPARQHLLVTGPDNSTPSQIRPIVGRLEANGRGQHFICVFARIVPRALPGVGETERESTARQGFFVPSQGVPRGEPASAVDEHTTLPALGRDLAELLFSKKGDSHPPDNPLLERMHRRAIAFGIAKTFLTQVPRIQADSSIS